MKPEDLIATAEKLAGGRRLGRRKQSDLRRAVSTAYYAMFHAMCRNAADQFIGATKAGRPNRAWMQAYRAVDHGPAKKQCSRQTILGEFPDAVQDFAATFVELQAERHRADYDPSANFTLSEARAFISRARRAIRELRGADARDRRAFAAYVALKFRE